MIVILMESSRGGGMLLICGIFVCLFVFIFIIDYCDVVSDIFIIDVCVMICNLIL